MPQTRTLRAALVLSAALLAAPALAQSPGAGSPASGAAPQGGTAAAGQRQISSTGATVPNPGSNKTGPETDRERSAQERSDRVTRSICNGC